MPRVSNGPARVEVAEAAPVTREFSRWESWPVSWTAVWVGALSAVAAVLVLGLIGIAVGAQVMNGETRWVEVRQVGWGTLIFSVAGAFFAFVLGGWVTGKVAGILRSETGMLHGAITWLVALPLLILLIALGAGSLMGGWYSGLGGSPGWAAPAQPSYLAPVEPGPGATNEDHKQYRADLEAHHEKIRQWHADSPRVARNSALGAVTVLLLSLMGGVLGGWMASGEPMSLFYYRIRDAAPAPANDQPKVPVS